ncbi:MAG TPA: hypothetical protein VK254_03220, partial [Candidatus Bathyarchaeia archaeon]|nr:hypothetical protein [Candidatus Bathyarchaeia archaeon]
MKLLSRKTYLLISLAIILYIFSGLVQSAWAAEGQVSSPKKDWQINERPSFEVKYAERGLAKRIFDWATFSFRSESSISAKLITQVSGETKDLKEGEDFVVDYSSGAAKIELSPMLEMKPGKQTLVAKITSEGEEYDITQDFTWGVLALNADKSIYAPKEVASLQFGVLDENGNMVCNAKLFLEIISPDGKSTLLSTENNRIKINEDVCSAKAYTLKPDYAAKYQLQEAGEYVLTLKAESEHGTYSISDKIEVHDSAAFEVKRTSATRIYPLNGYPVALDITANENFDGLIQESVPASFEIKKFEEDGYKAFDSQETQGSAKIITWKVSAKKGDKLKLGYQYDAPDISPEFYLLGPLKFVASQNLLQKIVSLSSADSKIVFEEVRQWQIASDAVGISLIGTPQTGVANNGANVTLTWSTRPSTGDVTVVIVGSPAATPAGCSVSTSDYQTAKTFTGSGNTQPTMAVFYKVQGATTDTNVVVKADGAATTDSTAIGYVLRGVDNANVLDQTATTAGVTTGTNPDPAAIVVQTNKAWVIASAVSVQAGDASPGTISGYTNHYQTTGSDTYNHTIAAATKEVATPATENPGKWSTWATGNWYAITTAIKAEPGITISGTSNVGVGTTVRAA